jgi:hypothetical protein
VERLTISGRRQGFEGYRGVAMQDLYNARLLSNAIERSGYYTVLSDIHRPIKAADDKGKGKSDPEDPENFTPGLPVVSFRFSEEFRQEYPHVQVRNHEQCFFPTIWGVADAPTFFSPAKMDSGKWRKVTTVYSLSAWTNRDHLLYRRSCVSRAGSAPTTLWPPIWTKSRSCKPSRPSDPCVACF